MSASSDFLNCSPSVGDFLRVSDDCGGREGVNVGIVSGGVNVRMFQVREKGLMLGGREGVNVGIVLGGREVLWWNCFG